MISINKLSKVYNAKPAVTALSNINLEIKEGELFGLIGPDGAGKTTLFKILASLLKSDKGSVSIAGLDVAKDRASIRRKIGYMPGEFSLYKDLTVQENLDFYASIYGVSMEQNYDVIREIYVQIEPFKNRRASKLSGGMKQKLALCCTLIHKPKVLLLDEPTTGVDPISRKEFWEILQRLKEYNMTIMVSTPYMGEANLCSRIAFIQSGKIISMDTPANFIEKYSHKIYALKSADNYSLLQRLENDSNVQLCYAFGEYLHVVFTDDSQVYIPNTEVKRVTPNIEDCFILLTSQ